MTSAPSGLSLLRPKLFWRTALCAFALAILAACSGGGGGGSASPSPSPSPSLPTFITMSTLKDRIYGPSGIVSDANGWVYVSAGDGNCIYRVAPSGDATLFAGSDQAAPSLQDGRRTSARFNRPVGLAIDAQSNLYVADWGNNAIRKVTPDGDVTTLAGSGDEGYVDGTGKAARFRAPTGIAIDGAGNLYVADNRNARIRKVTSAGVVTTLAGSGTKGNADGVGQAASFTFPFGIAVDGSGTVYVSDMSSHLIRRITPAGEVTTLAGAAGISGEVDGTGAAARFAEPTLIALDQAGNLYVPDRAGHTLRKVTPAGVVTTVAGTGNAPGHSDGAIRIATLNAPSSVWVGTSTNYGTKVWIAEDKNSDVRLIDDRAPVVPALTTVSTLASGISGPDGIVTDGSGNVFTVSEFGHCIYKTTPSGTTTVFAGSSAGVSGFQNGTGSAALFASPTGLAIDPQGNLYVAEWANHVIRKVTPGGVVTTWAGSGKAGYTDGSSDVAQFNYPVGLAIDGSGSLYVADCGNHLVRKIDPWRVVSTLAGSGVVGNVDGTGGAASFDKPFGIAVDGPGTVYVSDFNSHLIRRITPAGVVTLLAGVAGVSGETDGTGASARFSNPGLLSLDQAGNLFVADFGGHTIRQVTPAGAVKTVAGSANTAGSTDGPIASAQFKHPYGIWVAGTVIYVGGRDNTLRTIF